MFFHTLTPIAPPASAACSCDSVESSHPALWNASVEKVATKATRPG